MKLTDAQARALQAVRLGYTVFDDVDDRFYGVPRNRTLELLDRAGYLLVMWHHRQGRRVPVTISARGESELLKWERGRLARSKKRQRTVDAAAAVAHEEISHAQHK